MARVRVAGASGEKNPGGRPAVEIWGFIRTMIATWKQELVEAVRAMLFFAAAAVKAARRPEDAQEK